MYTRKFQRLTEESKTDRLAKNTDVLA
jgi:hypothetical protein